MADIELVVKIPEEIYEASQIIDVKHEDVIQIPLEVIANATPLPTGHGRLIDADEIQFENAEFDTYGDYCIAFDAIDQAEPIIEADKAESKEQEDGDDDSQ